MKIFSKITANFTTGSNRLRGETKYWLENSQFVNKFRDLKASNEIFIALLIVLIGFLGFGLGRLSKIEQNRPPITIEMPENAGSALANSASVSNTKNVSVLPEGSVVASKNGTKYYFPWCSGASRISEANKVVYKTIDLARAKGLTPASNCAGLK